MKYISVEGLEKLIQELERRRTVQRQEIAMRLEEAKALGDLSENTEYQSAKEAQAFNEGKIRELEDIIKKTTVIKPNQNGNKIVQIGATVEVQLINGHSTGKDAKQIFVIVGSQEANPGEGKISNESPLGLAFFEHKVGDIVEVETPRGKVKYKIKKIV